MATLRHGRASMIALAYVAALAGASAPPPRVAAADIRLLRQAQLNRPGQSIVRVPQAPRRTNQKPLKFKEKSAPSCISWARLAAAMISSPTTIDVIVRGGTRYRLKLERSCRSIDFYSGFYVKATQDGMVCEDRDMIHARSGGACVIGKFKTLIAAK